MQTVKNETKTYDLKVEKIIQKAPSDVFRAISEGRLFLNCGVDNETLKIDFRVGGKYHITVSSYEKSNYGEFLDIVPNQKIVFTWCQEYEPGAKPDTTVSIYLKDVDGKTHLTLTHEGFKDKEVRDAHEGGWTSGLGDLSNEIANGALRLIRKFEIPVQKLYEKCANPKTFFGIFSQIEQGEFDFKVGGQYRSPTECGGVKGHFIEIVPNKKITFTWISNTTGEGHETKVTLLFDDEDDGGSWLELIHEGLDQEKAQKSIREGWDWTLKEMKK